MWRKCIVTVFWLGYDTWLNGRNILFLYRIFLTHSWKLMEKENWLIIVELLKKKNHKIAQLEVTCHDGRFWKKITDKNLRTSFRLTLYNSVCFSQKTISSSISFIMFPGSSLLCNHHLILVKIVYEKPNNLVIPHKYSVFDLVNFCEKMFPRASS